MNVALSTTADAVTPASSEVVNHVTDHISPARSSAFSFQNSHTFVAGLFQLSAPEFGCARPRKEVNSVTSFFTYLDALRKREDGQTMAEYGVVLAVITLGVVVALGILSGAISDAINSVVGFL
jgi:Flp pilus assembly pilin Flp